MQSDYNSVTKRWKFFVFCIALLATLICLLIGQIAESQTHCIPNGGCNNFPRYVLEYEYLHESLKPRVPDRFRSTTRPASFVEAINLTTVLLDSDIPVLSWTSYDFDGNLQPWPPSIVFSNAIRTGLVECSDRLNTLKYSVLSYGIFAIGVFFVMLCLMIAAMHASLITNKFGWKRSRDLISLLFIPWGLVLLTGITLSELCYRTSHMSEIFVPTLPVCSDIKYNMMETCHMQIDKGFSLTQFTQQAVNGVTIAIESVTLGFAELIVYPILSAILLYFYFCIGTDYDKEIEPPNDANIPDKENIEARVVESIVELSRKIRSNEKKLKNNGKELKKLSAILNRIRSKKSRKRYKKVANPEGQEGEIQSSKVTDSEPPEIEEGKLQDIEQV